METSSFLSELLSRNNDVMINGYKAYPIYLFVVRWTELDASGNRINNSTSDRVMYNRAQLNEYVWNDANQWWVIVKNSRIDKKPELVHLKMEFICYDTWNTTWFSSESFNTHLSDSEVLASFEDYVQRHENDHWDILHGNSYDKTLVSLMGADDRWRWRAGANPDGSRDETDSIPAPCRCVHCTKLGKVRITH